MLAESLPCAPTVLPLGLRRTRNALLPPPLTGPVPISAPDNGTSPARGNSVACPETGWGQIRAGKTHNFGTALKPRWIVGTERLDQ